MGVKTAVQAPFVSLFYKAVQFNVALQKREYLYALILSHMRSGSTVLAHIFASHPEFCGAGETHTRYRDAEDLSRLVPITCRYLLKLQIKTKYVIDQINHRYVNDLVLSSPRVKCVILFREPERSIQSLMKLFDWDEEVATKSYMDRLADLAGYAKTLGNSAMTIEYDDMIERTDFVLKSLSAFYQVSAPFTSSYQTNRKSGKLGDLSPNIHTGTLVRTAGHNIAISRERIDRATKCFIEFKARVADSGAQRSC